MISRTSALLVLFGSAPFGCTTAPPIQQPDAAETAPLIELRLVRSEPAPGFVRVEFEGETLYLEAQPPVSDPDLTSVEPFIRPDELLFLIRMTDEAGARLQQVTGRNVGNGMALLVESRVRGTPIIRSAVGGPAPMMAGFPAPDTMAQRLAERIRAQWDPPADPLRQD